MDIREVIMGSQPSQRRGIIYYAASYMVFAAVAGRAFFRFQDTSNRWFMVGLLAMYLLLLILEPWLIRRNLVFLHVINALQVVISLALLMLITDFDYAALLFIIPCYHSIMHFPQRTALAWIGSICLVMVVALLALFPIYESIGYVFTYTTAIFLVTGFCYMALRAEAAQNRSEALLADLQLANQKLQDYAEQVEELAAAAERNRLARELHDSVTQIIFSLVLATESARILLEKNPSRVAAQLEHLQNLAQTALAEMRGLIQQLHPRPTSVDGLAAGLRKLAEERQTNDGLKVDLQVHGARRLPAKIEDELTQIAREALNNTVKHAHTDCAVITLNLDDGNQVSMEIEDAGAGFDPASVRLQPGHLGLTSMAERIEALGGTLTVDSKPRKGTCIRVKVAVPQEVDHA
jgi:signal transduction histidine kinase